ncbi:MAG: MarP family serine protease [Actinobacteria bacterium]|nr:MarP family serine protease [Actinomycetota bacterium]
MTRVDWIALGVVVIAAFAGWRRGLIGTALALGGLVGGAIAGARIAPHLLHGGTTSPYMPVVALAGAAVGAMLLNAVAGWIASFIRGGLRLVPPLRALDSLGGIAAGAAWGLVLVWVAGAVALQLPGHPSWQKTVQRSVILQRLNRIAPPSELLSALARIDQLPTLFGPAPPSLPPDPNVLAEPAVRAAQPSVVKVTALACGLGVEGSGWVAEPHLVVTAAHVVAGARDIQVDGHAARAFAVDRTNDVAVLDVPGLDAKALPFAAAQPGQAVAILGYPENGPFDARAGRIGTTERTLLNGRARVVTVFSGLVRHGNSGGPVVDGNGVVRTTVFASRVGSTAGFGVPTSAVRNAVADARRPVSTGAC